MPDTVIDKRSGDVLRADWATRSERESHALHAACIGTWEYDPATQLSFVDAVTRELFGTPEGDLTLKAALARIHPEDRARVAQGVETAIDDPHSPYDEVFRVRRADGTTRWLRGQGQMARPSPDAPPRMFGVNHDVTRQKELEAELREARDTVAMLNGELLHRMKNSYTMIAAMIRMSARSLDTVEMMTDVVTNRLMAMARAEELSWTGGERGSGRIGALAHDLLDTHPGLARRIHLSGEANVELASERVGPVALVLHELMTNAIKYGALHPGHEGHVDIHWWREADRAVLEWTEERLGGARMDPDAPVPGFGTRLIDSLARKIEARIARDWRPGGLRVRLEFASKVRF